jgi:hypothetical protein
VSETVEMERYCLNCKEETVHVLHYADGLLKEGRCTRCGSVFSNKLKLMEVYGENLMKRMLSKPLRLAEELREHPAETLMGLPGRAIRKPFKEAARIADLLESEESEAADDGDAEEESEGAGES